MKSGQSGAEHGRPPTSFCLVFGMSSMLLPSSVAPTAEYCFATTELHMGLCVVKKKNLVALENFQPIGYMPFQLTTP